MKANNKFEECDSVFYKNKKYIVCGTYYNIGLILLKSIKPNEYPCELPHALEDIKRTRVLLIEKYEEVY